MFKGNSLIDFINIFSPNDFKKNGDIIFLVECNFVERSNIYPNLNEIPLND